MIGREEETERMRSRITNTIQTRNELTARIRKSNAPKEMVELDRDRNLVRTKRSKERLEKKIS